MARARNIKPGLCKNEDLAECSIWARHLFACLPMFADREGRLEDRPKRLKAEIFPFDSQEIEPLLRELSEHGSPPFIVRYQNEQGKFIQITRFKEHQSPHYSEKPSVIKPPPLQEKAPNGSAGNSGSNGGMKEPGNQEHSGSSTTIKRGSQPPDSLIPDSLIPESPPTPPRGESQAFSAFWAAWPKSERKEARGECWRIWHRGKFDAVANEILAHVEACKHTERWKGGFICAPKVYLNNRRWEGAEIESEDWLRDVH